MIIQKSAMLVHAEETYIKPDPFSDEDPTRPAPDGALPVPESHLPKSTSRLYPSPCQHLQLPNQHQYPRQLPWGGRGGGKREIGVSEGIRNGIEKSMKLRSMTHKGLQCGGEWVYGGGLAYLERKVCPEKPYATTFPDTVDTLRATE
jgi:hypothetical protein